MNEPIHSPAERPRNRFALMLLAFSCAMAFAIPWIMSWVFSSNFFNSINFVIGGIQGLIFAGLLFSAVLCFAGTNWLLGLIRAIAVVLLVLCLSYLSTALNDWSDGPFFSTSNDGDSLLMILLYVPAMILGCSVSVLFCRLVFGWRIVRSHQKIVVEKASILDLLIGIVLFGCVLRLASMAGILANVPDIDPTSVLWMFLFCIPSIILSPFIARCCLGPWRKWTPIALIGIPLGIFGGVFGAYFLWIGGAVSNEIWMFGILTVVTSVFLYLAIFCLRWDGWRLISNRDFQSSDGLVLAEPLQPAQQRKQTKQKVYMAAGILAVVGILNVISHRKLQHNRDVPYLSKLAAEYHGQFEPLERGGFRLQLGEKANSEIFQRFRWVQNFKEAELTGDWVQCYEAVSCFDWSQMEKLRLECHYPELSYMTWLTNGLDEIPLQQLELSCLSEDTYASSIDLSNAPLGKMVHLKHLGLRSSNDLNSLGSLYLLPQLRSLDLSDSKVTPDNLDQLSQCPQLKKLTLRNVDLKREHYAALRNLKLNELDLRETDCNVESLIDELTGRRLKLLLNSGQVSKEDRDRLQKADLEVVIKE